MRRLTGLSIAVLFLAALPVSAQQILPDSIAGWTNGGVAAEPALPQPVLNEYGLVSSVFGQYTRGSESLNAGLYTMKDPSGAYGLYSYLRAPDMARANFTDHSSISRERALVLAGDLVLDVQGKDIAKFQPQLRALVAAIQPRAHEGILPMLGQYLPQKSMIERTDHYVLGPQTLNQLFPGGIGESLGFRSGAEAELAHYRLLGRDATLLVVSFPTDQIAMRQIAELQKNFNVNGASQASGAPQLFAKRSARLLAIVSGATSQTEADTLLDQVQMETELTWNEPTFQFKEPSIEMMIEGSIIGAGTICMFALIAGLSFGGLRLVMKRFMPGKIFDTKKHLEVLQLGLGSKAINSDDFYGYSAPADPGNPVDKNLPDRVALRIFR
ncbi:MAG: DUF6599 family protein [Candidatus Acidiferrales bacterium]